MRSSLILALACALAAGAHAERIHLTVDLREAPKRVFHAQETIPVTPGSLGLRYPKWLPGEHTPSGPVVDLAGLRISAGRRALAWERDPVDMHLFRVEVPADVSQIEVALDYLVPASEGGFSEGPSATARLAVLSWNTVLLYPDVARPLDLQFEPTLELPAGWEPATSLRIAEKRSARVRYAPVTLETLIDSPVSAGIHYKAIELDTASGSPEHVLHLVADSEAALAAKPEAVLAYKRMVAEALALFGAHHYGRYDFLLTLSDHVAHFGLEHHESSDNRSSERALLDESLSLANAGLLPHELVHSWNGKYRRPQGLVTGDLHTPVVTDLLWVYEGLTAYLGDVLAARAGLLTPEQARDGLAFQAAGLAATKGREWRPLLDTARDARDVYDARWGGVSWRRGTDFYEEGELLWLEVDTLIRTQTKGAASLDDFCKRFFGAPDTGPEVKPYTRADLVAALAATAPYDWEAFFAKRVDGLRPDPPIEGIAAAGWSLVYGAEPNAIAKAYSSGPDAGLDLRFSLGAWLSDDGTASDIVPGSPLAKAGLPVGAKIVAVNSRAFSDDVMDAALAAAKESGAIELLVQNSEYFTTLKVDYKGGGERNPHLARDETRPDLLAQIHAPRTWKPEPPKEKPAP